MKKNYTQAPLPFMGQKRRWNQEFKCVLKEEFSDCSIFVDLFGGSGLLSYFTKSVRPDAMVIYNDFDNYSRRIEAIPTTNAPLRELRGIMDGYQENKRIVEPYLGRMLETIEQYESRGFVDYVTLSASILFSGKYVTSFEELKKNGLYNTIKQSDYSADHYLDGLTVIHEDYRAVFRQWEGKEGVCFLIDPPYLSTQSCTYAGYWKLRDYLDVLHTLNGTNFFYFTSEKSSILELCDWLDCEYKNGNPFDGATRVEQRSNLNYQAGYTDIMLYKHQRL
ncbi:MAG: DNA adenine methylase [Bacteroidales bacterium]|nr:DNA adenine methylase [Bacteroidales bacterium]MBQ6100875.1 DNA adenine methylase [Bacteroidales bacterium]